MAEPVYPVFYVHTGSDEVIMENWRRVFPDAFWDRIRIVHYTKMFESGEVQIAHTIFGDLERLDPVSRKEATGFWNLLARCGKPIALLNHPNRAAMRYELLRRLYDRGLNDFNVYRLVEARLPERYPVFVRGENDHLGAMSGLLPDAAALETHIDKILDHGLARNTVLIEEFVDTVGTDGVYRKYSTFKVGDAIVPAHIFFSKRWNVKKADIADDTTRAEERAFIDREDLNDQIRDIFALAEIDFGRIDFGIKDGRIQTWEINTHPVIIGNSTLTEERLDIAREFISRFSAAFLAIGADSAAPASAEAESAT